MRLKTRRINWVMLGLATLVLGLIGYQAQAIRNLARTPSVVATVDIVRAFNALEERAASETQLQSEIDAMLEANRQREAELTSLREDLEEYAPGSDKYKEIEDQLLRDTYQYRARMSFIEVTRERRFAEITLQLYNRIRDSVKRMSEAEGIDIVFVDDTKVQITMGTEAEITRQISARRMLYVNPMIDVTDQLIELMNREFQAGPRLQGG